MTWASSPASTSCDDAADRDRRHVGAGKTTLGKRLAAKLNLTFIELDALHHQENWTPNPNFAEDVPRALETPRWVVDGNYSSKLQGRVLERADTLVWLDYSLGTKLRRLLGRSLRRVVTRETLWNGNTETVRGQFFSRDTLFVWLFKTHWKQRRRYEALFAATPERLRCYRLDHPRDAEVLLEQVRSDQPPFPAAPSSAACLVRRVWQNTE